MGIPQDSITADRLNRLIGTAECPVNVDVRREKAFDESDRMITTADCALLFCGRHLVAHERFSEHLHQRAVTREKYRVFILVRILPFDGDI